MAPPRFLERGPLPFLGRISYSVYLLHPVVLLGFGAFGGVALLASLGVGRTLTYVLAAAICSAVVILLSWGTFHLIEAPGMAAGRRLVRRARERGAARHLDDVEPDNEPAESLAAVTPGASGEARAGASE